MVGAALAGAALITALHCKKPIRDAMKLLTPDTLRAWRIKREWTIPYAAGYFGVGERTWWRMENVKISHPRLVTMAVNLVDVLTKKKEG